MSPTTSVAIVNVFADGSCTLYCGTVDMGQGSDTAMAQLVAERGHAMPSRDRAHGTGMETEGERPRDAEGGIDEFLELRGMA